MVVVQFDADITPLAMINISPISDIAFLAIIRRLHRPLRKFAARHRVRRFDVGAQEFEVTQQEQKCGQVEEGDRN